MQTAAEASARVTTVYRNIAATRMAGLAIVHPRIEVACVGMRAWAGEWLGVLITPWAINLLLLPGPDSALCRLAPDQRQRWCFPSGEYEFFGHDEPELGCYQSCALVSPLAEFAGQSEALAFATAALDALLTPPPAAPDPRRRALLGLRRPA